MALFQKLEQYHKIYNIAGGGVFDAEFYVSVFKDVIRKFWGDVRLYLKYWDFIKLRYEFLLQLSSIKFDGLELQATDIDASFRTKFFTINDDLVFIAPSIHYRILPNELVFDLDVKDLNQVNGFVRMFKTFGVEPLVGDSGGRGYHIHVLLAPPKGDIREFLEAEDLKVFRDALFDYFLELSEVFGVDASKVDTGVMKFSAHTIRSFYSYNPRGRSFKTPIYGSRYPFLTLTPGLYKVVVERMERGRRFSKVIESIEDGGRKRVGRTSKISWIEQLLQHPEPVTDGRRRLLIHVIIPYLINIKKLSKDEVEKLCCKWVKKTSPKGGENYYRSLIRYEVKVAGKKGLLPMRRDKFFKIHEDLKFIDEAISK